MFLFYNTPIIFRHLLLAIFFAKLCLKIWIFTRNHAQVAEKNRSKNEKHGKDRPFHGLRNEQKLLEKRKIE
jgi:hypothetical protein